MTSMKTYAVFVLLLALCGCVVGPNYKRPPATLPDQYRGLAPDTSTQSSNQAFGEMKWFDVFQDQILVGLIREALINNYDLRIAATRVMQAKAIVGITRADQLPSVERLWRRAECAVSNSIPSRRPSIPCRFRPLTSSTSGDNTVEPRRPHGRIS